MSSPSRWVPVCDPPTAVGPTPVSWSSLCKPLESPASSPIDSYYEFVEELLRLGSVEALDRSPALGRLLILGLVSSVETYLRNVLSGVLQCCERCRQHAADVPVPLGAIDYYLPGEIELGILDRASLASAKEVRSWTNKLWGFELKDQDIGGTLADYDKLCHLRHASVHSQGRLGSANARGVELEPSAGRQALSVSFGGLQDAGVACHAFVRSFNTWAWRKHVERWNSSNIFIGLWRDDKQRFGELLSQFYSERDNNGPADPRSIYQSLPFGYRMRA